MVSNQEYIIKRTDVGSIGELGEILRVQSGSDILRWHISRVEGASLVVEATLFKKSEQGGSRQEALGSFPGKSVVVSIIPTGVGCEVGGYAADAAPVTALLSSCCDYLITNPNAVNASNFISIKDNTLYTEGYILDLFCMGKVNLYQPYANKVGLIVEKADQKSIETVYNLVNTVRAVYGVGIESVVITDKVIGGRCVRHKSGAYVGTLDDPGVLFKAADELIGKGVNAIGITSNIQDLFPEHYARHFDGLHPNPVGGAEAIISHLISEKYGIPAAHAPMINEKEFALKNNIVDARGAGEFSSVSGLACILVGLSKAPQINEGMTGGIKDIINIKNLMAVVAPAGTMGGIPVLSAQKYNIPVIAVKGNKTILDVGYQELGLKNVFLADDYVQAAGILQALRNGIDIRSLYRPLATLRPY